MQSNLKTILAFFKGQASIKQFAKALLAILSPAVDLLPDDKFNQPADPDAIPVPAMLVDEAGSLAWIEETVNNGDLGMQAAIKIPDGVKTFLLQWLMKILLGV